MTAPAGASPSARESAAPAPTSSRANRPATRVVSVQGGPATVSGRAPATSSATAVPRPAARVCLGCHRPDLSLIPVAMVSATSSKTASGSSEGRGRR